MHRDYADPAATWPSPSSTTASRSAAWDGFRRITRHADRTASFTAAESAHRDTFHRTGAVEIWGGDESGDRGVPAVRGAAPTFEEQGGAVVVTFRAPIGAGPSRDQAVAQPDQRAVLRWAPPATHSLADDALRQGQPDQVPRSGLAAPSRCWSPGYDGSREARSSKQQYRTTQAGAAGLEDGPPNSRPARCLGSAETRTSPTVGLRYD